MRWYEKCCRCGRFCTPADSGVMFGGPADFEPPDEDMFCKSCYDEELKRAIENPEDVIIGCWWIKPHYVQVAKSVLRHKRNAV